MAAEISQKQQRYLFLFCLCNAGIVQHILTLLIRINKSKWTVVTI